MRFALINQYIFKANKGGMPLWSIQVRQSSMVNTLIPLNLASSCLQEQRQQTIQLGGQTIRQPL